MFDAYTAVYNCPNRSPLPPLAFMTMAIILLHMFWGVVFFDACEKQRWWAVAAVVISHLVVSCLVSTDSELWGFISSSCWAVDQTNAFDVHLGHISPLTFKDSDSEWADIHFCFFSFSSDLPEPRLRCQSGSHLRHIVPHGRLGLLRRWRIPQKPQALPHLQRQGLSAR